MRLPTALCKMQRKRRESDGFSKSTLMTPPGSHPTSGFGARHGLPKFFRHKKRRIVQNDAANWWSIVHGTYKRTQHFLTSDRLGIVREVEIEYDPVIKDVRPS